MKFRTLKFIAGIDVFSSLFLCVKSLFRKQKKERFNEDETTSEHLRPYTTKEIMDNLIIYYPDYTDIDLVCGTMPSKKDKNVIFCAEAAFTGNLLKEFKHTNIAGDHVSSGIRYAGFKCRRNTGAFVYYKGHYEFLYQDYSDKLDDAAKNGGMGFVQETMIHRGQRVKCKRKDSNKNEFRALCELNGRLCVIDSKGAQRFGDFIQNLMSVGVTYALYLDMGNGWNYSWYRDKAGDINEIHCLQIIYTTNWITFYNE